MDWLIQSITICRLAWRITVFRYINNYADELRSEQLLYGITPMGHFIVIYILAILFVFVMSGFGLVISNYSATMQQSMFVMFFFMLVLMLMSGLFTPVSSMPEWAQMIAYFNPLKYFMQGMRIVYLKGSGLMELLPELGVLLLFALGFNSWAVISYRKNQ